MPDDKLMHALYELRGQGRNDFPIGATWNSILAGIVFQHASVESLRRELRRNAQFREMCGFNPILGVGRQKSVRRGSFLSKNLKTTLLRAIPAVPGFPGIQSEGHLAHLAPYQ